MSKAIVKTLLPQSRVVFRSDLGFYIVEDRGTQIGRGANTPQDAWHEASAKLRSDNYDAWFDAASKPTKPRQKVREWKGEQDND